MAKKKKEQLKKYYVLCHDTDETIGEFDDFTTACRFALDSKTVSMVFARKDK